MARVVVQSDDLLAGSNLVGALRAEGHAAELVGSIAQLAERADDADVVVVDLAAGGADGLARLTALRAGGQLGGARTLAVYAHVDADMRARASAAGCDLVVPRSRMLREGGRLVAELARER